jgi:peptidyl-prolyl cis-trans isomerase C
VKALDVKEDALKKLLPVLLILACAGFAGCSKFGGGEKGKTALGSDVVAQVGDEKITAKDIDEILSRIPTQYRQRHSTAQGRREIIDGMVNIKMLAWEARNRGLDKRESVKMKIAFLTDQTLAKELESELKKSFKVSEADIMKYYQEHQDKYVTPERIKAIHILVDSEAQAKSILKQVKKGGDFGQLARQHSKCQSAQRGGDLGWFGKGKMDPAFEKAAFALKKGEVSEVVKSPSGYHIIRLDDRRETRTRTLDQVSRSIERIIQRERMEKELGSLKDGIRKKASVAVNDEYFKKFPNEPQPPAGGPGLPGPMPRPASAGAPAAGPTAPPAAGKMQAPGAAAPAPPAVVR